MNEKPIVDDGVLGEEEQGDWSIATTGARVRRKEQEEVYDDTEAMRSPLQRQPTTVQ